MEQNTSDSLFGLQVDPESATYFREASKWARFIAIACIVAFGLFLLMVTLMNRSVTEGLRQAYGQTDEVDGFVTGLIVVFVLIGIAVSILLLRYANLTGKGVEGQDQLSFNEGLKSLKYFFLIIGVISVLSMVFSVINILGSAF